MTITQSIYIRRNGGMVFWRVGSLGGSLYVAKHSDEAKAQAKAAKRERKQQLRFEAKLYRWYSRHGYLRFT